jgi:hypothetical protein
MEGEQQARVRFTSRLLLSDEDILALGIKKEWVESFRRQRYQAAFGIESWYDDLREHTFYTKSVSLSYEEAKALSQYHYFITQSMEISHESLERVKGIEQRIDEAINSDERLAIGAFIKLNTRSPKDVVLYDFSNENVAELVKKELAMLYAQRTNQSIEDLLLPSGKFNIPKDQREDNAETSVFVVATNRALKVTSGSEALYLLAKSDRISEDLNKILPFGEEHFSLNLILREWLDEVVERPQFEFRAFVHQNQLNAMSQYFCFCKYEDLIAQEEEVKETILKFHSSIRDSISHTSYVIDFYIKKDGGVLIIELNPFHNGAGAALFSWAKDRERFLHGPFEFRITRELKENPKDILPPFWVRKINSFFADEKENQQKDKPCLLS